MEVRDVSKFYTKQGRLTSFALACGYIEQHTEGELNTLKGMREAQQVTLWMENSVYHVRAHDFANGKRLFWDTFHTLTGARKRYDRAVRELKAAANEPQAVA